MVVMKMGQRSHPAVDNTKSVASMSIQRSGYAVSRLPNLGKLLGESATTVFIQQH
jgi:hypothetical protein